MSSLSTSDKKVLSTVKNGGVTPKETLTPFYGKDTDKVLRTAKVARLSASGLAVPEGNPKVDAVLERSDIRNLQVVSPGSGQNEGSKEANKAEWNVARAHVNAGLERGVPVTPVMFGGSDSYFNRATGEIQLGDKANANHEVSHPLNPTLLEPGGKSSAWLNENFNEAYYLGNNGELSAALGSLKRGAYQQFGDLSEPGAMSAFLEREDVKDLMDGKPTRGASALHQVLSSDATDFLQGLQYLRNKQTAGTITDEEAQRLNVTESALQNPDYLKQLVRNDPTDYAPDARKEVMADEAGGTAQDVAPDADPAVSDKPPVEEREPSPEPSAPARIIINPKVFKDKRDGLCVAYNEAFRVIMEMNGFDPQAEPTEEQRKFFSDTAYADDERMLRRTILARICTFDDSVKNPTDEQLDEALEFLETVMEIGAPQSEEEQANVQRIHDMIAEIRKAPRPEEALVEEARVESEAPPVADIGGGWTRDENGRLPGSNWTRDENGRLPGPGRTVETSEPIDRDRGASRELRREQRERKVLTEYRERTADAGFMGDIGEGLSPEVDTEPQTEIPVMAPQQVQEDAEPAAQPVGPAAPAQNSVRVGRRADGSLVEGSLRDMRDEYGQLIRNDAKGGKATDDTYVTNSGVVMPESEARKMGVVTQSFEHAGDGQVSIPFDEFRVGGSAVDVAQQRAESYGSAEAAKAAVAAAMEARAKRYPGGVPAEAAKDPESVPIVPAGVRPGPWDEAYLSYSARVGHPDIKTVKSGSFIHTAGYIPGQSLALIPTRVVGASSPAIETRRLQNRMLSDTAETRGNGRVVSISDAANPNRPGWYTADEGYRAAALGSIKGWLTANKRAPGENDDLAAVMAAAYRDKASLKLGKIDKNGKDFLAFVAKAYKAERDGKASRRDKEILKAARDTDMWEQVVGARRYDRYSTTV